MSTLLLWDRIFEILGDVDLNYISISSFSREIELVIVKSSQRGLNRSSIRVGSNKEWVMDNPSTLPIYEDTSCNKNKKTKLKLWEINFEFSNQEIPIDKDFRFYINIKRS